MARPAPVDVIARDTIVAPATAAGSAALAIVRLSGPDAHAIADAVFTPARGGDWEWARLRLGTLRTAEGAGDECLCVRWKAPSSATGEDVAELHLHGSPAIVRAAVEACVRAGARPATPGEFTRRAFLNGRMDLSQAEGVAALCAAQTNAGARAALAQLRGGTGARVAAGRALLVELCARLEATVDFPEEELPAMEAAALRALLDRAQAELAALAQAMGRGERLQRGARVVLAGVPNAGKSSLFNALLRRERAIVSPHPGTTRDTIEAAVDLGGIPVTLVDTAGVREGAGELESLGIERTWEEAASADLVLAVLDGTAPQPMPLPAGVPVLAVTTKRDLLPGALPPGSLAVSATTRVGVEALEAAIVHALLGGDDTGAEAIAASARQRAAIATAREALARCAEAVAHGLSPEFPALHATEALVAVDSVAPRAGSESLDEAVLSAVFAQFCIGK